MPTVFSKAVCLILLASALPAIAPLVAQDAETDRPLTGPAAAAIASVQRLYERREYSAAVTAADLAMRKGRGSTALQAWRLASLAQCPITQCPRTGPTPLRTARRMASMHPESPWAWMGLAMTAAAEPDSASVARTAARTSVTFAPNEPDVVQMAARALRQSGYAAEALAVLDSAPKSIAATPKLRAERAATLAALQPKARGASIQ